MGIDNNVLKQMPLSCMLLFIPDQFSVWKKVAIHTCFIIPESEHSNEVEKRNTCAGVLTHHCLNAILRTL